MFFAYVIRNEKRKIYIGHTNDLSRRLARHNGQLPQKSTSFTHKNKGIWQIIHSETFETRSAAMRREKELKSYRGRMFIRTIIHKEV